ncbi:MAG: family 10 glycosylhydrolase [Fimbriimonadaceae bacterium]|nr:family 10 glycosylhydrolase [Fimbriimonadaceae bacterium]
MLMWGALCVAMMGQPSMRNQSVAVDPPREFRAAWVATVANIDWPTKPGLSTADQQAEMQRIVDVAVKMRLNALVFQGRPHGDALYESQLEPWSYYLTGTQGKAPKPKYDPLHYLIQIAHKAGIEVHVWFNPYRANHSAQRGPMAATHFSRRNPGTTYTYGTFEWMDPAQKRVQDHSLAVMLDVVKRYDIDGVHIDDYFYPYPVTQNGRRVPFPDQATYQAYRNAGGTLSLSDFRRDAVNSFIKNLYDGIKKEKKWVKFGISPFGIYRPGVPSGIAAGIDQYEDLSADALLWFKEGWCDYYSPQLYWPIEQTPQSFPVLLNWWTQQNDKQRHLWPGLYTSRLNPNDGNWKPDQLKRQVDLIRRAPHAKGEVHFSMKAIVNDWNGIRTPMRDQMYAEGAVVPSCPWLDNVAPDAPGVGFVGRDVDLSYSQPDFRFFVIMQTVNGKDRVIRQTNENKWTAPTAGTYKFAVRDRSGNVGPAATITVR